MHKSSWWRQWSFFFYFKNKHSRNTYNEVRSVQLSMNVMLDITQRVGLHWSHRAFITRILVVEHTVTSPTRLSTNGLLSSTNYLRINSPAPLSRRPHSSLLTLLPFTIPTPNCHVLFCQQMAEQESSQQTGDFCRFRVPEESFLFCTDCCVRAVFK